MPIIVNQDMVDVIAGDNLVLGNSEWEGATISYAFNVDPGNMVQEIVEFLGLGSTFTPDPVNPSGNANNGNYMQMLQIVGLWDDLIAPSMVNQPGDDGSDITVNQVSNMLASSGGVTCATFAFPLIPDDADVYLMNNAIRQGKSSWEAAVHEFGHALNLMHPGSYNANGDPITNEANREFDEDTALFSIMSYCEPRNWNPLITWTRSQVLTPMIYDILAIQGIYGADMTTRTDDTTCGFNNTSSRSIFLFDTAKASVFTIWDAGGQDTIDASLYTQDQVIELAPGTYSNIGGLVSNVGIAFSAVITARLAGRAMT